MSFRESSGQWLQDDASFAEMDQDIKRFASVPSVHEVLANGVDLDNYSTQINKELREMEVKSIDEYLGEVESSIALKEDIKLCQNVLEKMESIVSEYHTSLGQLSNDISTLQAKSQVITTKLNNRKLLQEDLGRFVGEVVLSRHFINKICETKIGPAYIPYLNELSSKIAFIKSNEARSSKSAQSIKICVDRLRAKASENIKMWAKDQIDALSKYYETEQISIQSAMLACKQFMTFLKDNSPDIEQSIRKYYIKVMSTIYCVNFAMLTARVENQMNPSSTSSQLLVNTVSKSLLGKNTKKADDPKFFALGDRKRLINELMSPPQQFGVGSFRLESLMRSLYQTYIDAITAENLFVTSFFSDPLMTSKIFKATSKCLDLFSNKLIPNLYDPFTLLYIIAASTAQSKELQNRRLQFTEGHLETLTKKATERFNTVMVKNAASLHDFRPPAEGYSSPSTLPITKRFTDLCVSLLSMLSPELGPVISRGISQVTAPMLDLLEKQAASLPSEYLSPFQINNFFYIIVATSDIDKLGLMVRFEEKLSQSISSYIDGCLNRSFSDLYQIVTTSFTELEKKEDPKTSEIDLMKLKTIASEFKDRHAAKMKEIADSQSKLFDDPANAREILSSTAKRLVLFWTKFYHLCSFSVHGNQTPHWMNSMISPQQVVLNIRPFTEILK